MKKWLPIFLIAILLAKPVFADENESTNDSTKETEDTNNFDTKNWYNATDPNTKDEELKEYENTYPTQENEKPEIYYEPYEDSYEEPYETPLIEDPIIEESEELEGPEELEEPETPVVENPTKNPVHINLLEEESYAIFGTVLIDGKETSDIEVTLKGEKEQIVKTDKDGTFSFKTLTPGDYKILPTYKINDKQIEPIEVTISNRDKVDILFDIKNDAKKAEMKEESTAVKNIEEDNGSLPFYLKWIIVIGALLVPVSVILYFVFRKV